MNVIMILYLNVHRWTCAVSRLIVGGFKLGMLTKNLWMGNNVILRLLSTLKSYECMIFLLKKCEVYFRKTFIRKNFFNVTDF